MEDIVASTPAFVMRGVRFSYAWRGKPIPALRDIDLVIPRGQFVAIAGSNGSGKSTCASLLNAMLQPDEGRVEVFGMDAADPAHLWEIRRRVGLIMENPDNQIVGPTVADDIAFGPENLGLEHAEIVSRVESALDALGIQELRSLEPHLLSEGQKQKVAIAGVIATGAEAIVSDESTGLLDPETRSSVLDLFAGLRDAGITVLHITHLPDEALLAERLIVIEDGRVAADTSPEDFFRDADLVRDLRFDQPALFSLARELSQRGLRVPLVSDPAKIASALCP